MNDNTNHPIINIDNLHSRKKSFPVTLPSSARSGSLSVSQHGNRKSFFGELKNFLTFKKKSDSVAPEDDENEDGKLAENGNEMVLNALPSGRRKAEIFEKEVEEQTVTPQEKNLSQVARKANTLQMSIKKWKLMKSVEAPRETIAVNPIHQKYLDDAVDRLKIEVPRPLEIIINEEALMIVTKTMQMYKSMLGSKHKLTKEAEEHMKMLKLSVKEPK